MAFGVLPKAKVLLIFHEMAQSSRGRGGASTKTGSLPSSFRNSEHTDVPFHSFLLFTLRDIVNTSLLVPKHNLQIIFTSIKN